MQKGGIHSNVKKKSSRKRLAFRQALPETKTNIQIQSHKASLSAGVTRLGDGLHKRQGTIKGERSVLSLVPVLPSLTPSPMWLLYPCKKKNTTHEPKPRQADLPSSSQAVARVKLWSSRHKSGAGLPGRSARLQLCQDIADLARSAARSLRLLQSPSRFSCPLRIAAREAADAAWACYRYCTNTSAGLIARANAGPSGQPQTRSARAGGERRRFKETSRVPARTAWHCRVRPARVAARAAGAVAPWKADAGAGGGCKRPRSP